MYSLTGRIDSYFLPLSPIWRVPIIMLFIAAAAAVAYRKKLLTASGTAAASVLGFIVFYISGVSGIFIFLFFFITASAVSALIPSPAAVVRKSGARDYMQVIANGLPAVIALIMYRLFGYSHMYLAAFAAAIAEAEADTFASSFGLLSRKPPRSIITGTIVPPGISGGITLLGSLSAVFGSFLVAFLYSSTYGTDLYSFIAVLVSGASGSFLDSFLGAAVQIQYRAPDGTLTEKSEIDGKPLERVRGNPRIDNDAVNLISGIVSALIAMSLCSFV